MSPRGNPGLLKYQSQGDRGGRSQGPKGARHEEDGDLGSDGGGDDRVEERVVHGGSGNDILYGDAGEDVLYGGPGTDTVISVGDGEADVVDCGDGTDTVKRGSDQNLDRFVGCERFVR